MTVCIAVTAAALAAPVASGLADGPPGALDQTVLADNSAAGTVLARSALVTVRDTAPGSTASTVADPTNFARANAHDCTTGCQAIAAAFQVVLVPPGKSTSAPQNVALATNVNCTHCGSFAYAYQYVVNVVHDVRLSGSARQQIAQLRAEADQDVRSGVPYVTLDGQMHDLATRLRGVVDGDLAQQHVGENHRHSQQTFKDNPAG